MDEEAIDYLRTRIENRIRRAFREMVREIKDDNGLRELEQSIARGDIDALLHGIDDAAEKLAVDINTGYVQAGQRASRWLDSEVDARVTFDVADDSAIEWMTDQADTLVRAMVQEQQAVARRVVEIGRGRGWSDADIAEDVRSSIGLNLQQVDYVDSYRDALEGGDFRDAIDRAMGDGRYDAVLERADDLDLEIAPDRIDAMVDAYRDDWVDYRGDFIANMEGQSATFAGIEESIDQADDSGDIEAGLVSRTWVTKHDPKVRSSHRAMDGQERAPGELFMTGAGVELRYPGDEEVDASETANCRCELTYEYASPAAKSRFRHLDKLDGCHCAA